MTSVSASPVTYGRCPRCQALKPTHAVFCPNCGLKFAEKTRRTFPISLVIACLLLASDASVLMALGDRVRPPLAWPFVLLGVLSLASLCFAIDRQRFIFVSAVGALWVIAAIAVFAVGGGLGLLIENAILFALLLRNRQVFVG